MTILIFFTVVAFVLPKIYIKYRKDRNAVENYFSGVLISMLILCVPAVIAMRFTTGLYEGYSEGYRIGYITKLSREGLIYKTWEGELQVGSGQMAAISIEPFDFSITDQEVLKKVQNSDGKQVKLFYTQWLSLPYRYGSSKYIIVKVE